MIRSQKPTPEKGCAKVWKWDYEAPENGKSTVGFLAGPPCGCWVHFTFGSKPCRRKMTKSKLVCPFCEDKWEPVWRGYVPYYDREYVRRFVVITEDYYESVNEIELHAQIRLSRDKDTHAPVVIRPDTWRTQPLPTKADRAEPVDLMPFLCRVLWKDAELTEYAEQTELELDGKAEEFEDKGLSKMQRLLKREKATAAEQALGDVLAGEVMNRVLKPAANANGRYKPPK
jgi:hypothetical protein